MVNSTPLDRPASPTVKTRLHPAHWPPALYAFLFYCLLTLIFAWPVVANLGVGTPGHFPVDRNQNLWNFWWVKRSVFAFHNPYQTTFLFYPYGTSLYLQTFSPYNQVIGLPLQLLFGLVPAYSFIELLAFPLGGLGGFFLGRYLTGNFWGGLLAGLVWSFGPYHYVELRQDQLNLISLQWLPFFMLFMFRLEKAETRPAIIREGLVAALFFFLTLMVDYYYASYLGLFAGLYWLWKLLSGLWLVRRGQEKIGQIGRDVGLFALKLAGVFILGALPYAPVLLGTIREVTSGSYQLATGNPNDQVHSADLATVFLPPAHQPWWGNLFGLWKSIGINASGAGDTLNNWGAVISFVPLALAVYALFRVRGLWFWVFNGLFWFLLAFGPSLRINNVSTNFPMPYRLLTKLPFLDIGRFPERYMLLAQFSVGILAAFGLTHLLNRLPKERRVFSRLGWPSVVAGLVLALAFFETWPGILPPPDPITQPAFTKYLAADNGSVPADKALLELPITTHGNPDSPRMLYQIYHQRPITGGYISRKLVDPHRQAHDSPLYDWIDLRDPQAPDIIPTKTPQEALGLLSYQDFGYLVLYADDPDQPGQPYNAKKAETLLNYVFGGKKPDFQDSVARVWNIPQTPLPNPVMVLGQGWAASEPVSGGGRQRWLDAAAADARVIIVAGPDTPLQPAYNLDIQAVSPDKPRHLTVLLNGTVITQTTVNPGVQSLHLAGLKLQPGENVITLRPDPADGVFVPSQANPASKDNRSLRLAFISLKLS
ncbi:MAG: hypothetical protein J0I20_26265 [Chloroflexi bacterium]|nr:hypothetical protein [Chloroflexota bacterium]OJW06444.1 MAG: hypothetical protein BGO39_00030 [Chloroflexi bacterium 54-19]